MHLRQHPRLVSVTVLAVCILLMLILRQTTPSAHSQTNYSLRFYGNGVNDIDRVKIPLDNPPRSVDVGAADFTLEFWMQANPGDNNDGNCSTGNDAWISGNIMFDRDIYNDGDYGDYGVSLYGGRIAFGVSQEGGGATICSAAQVADGAWHHIAVTRNAASGQLRIFVDGRLSEQGGGPTGNVSYRDGRPTSYPNDPYLVIGAEKHDEGSEFPSFSGWIDEVRISNIIRYGGNFNRPAQQLGADGNTMALYHFDEGSGATLRDTTGQNDGTIKVGGNPQGPQWSTENPFTGGTTPSPTSPPPPPGFDEFIYVPMVAR